MLHEVLLGLSGHASPLFRSDSAANGETSVRHVSQDFPDLSASEASMLETLGKLALLHRQLRALLKDLLSTHPSTICRAVASSLLYTHCGRFQEQILAVERQILITDPSLVGAYNIVPLSMLVGEFDGWTRLMNWYWQTACVMRPPASNTADKDESGTTGAAIIDHLRSQSQTGFPDIEAAAVELSRIAESAWLKQLSSWILQGKLPHLGAEDFFIRSVESASEGSQDHATFDLDGTQLPAFVSAQTAASLLFIGKSLSQLRQYRDSTKNLSSKVSSEVSNIATEHLHILSALPLPLSASRLSRTITSIRASLSQRVLQHLISMQDVDQCLRVLQQFFLLGRGGFAAALIAEAAETVRQRQQTMGRLLQGRLSRDRQTLAIREAELTDTLLRTWRSLSTASAYDEEDHCLELARNCIRLDLSSSTSKAPSHTDEKGTESQAAPMAAFDDVLFPAKTSLTMHAPPPLDLFLAPSDLQQYSAINSYLLALRRAHQRLSGLWLLTSARRTSPGNTAPTSAQGRKHAWHRSASLRKVWATCSSALFLLSETAAYLEGEVVQSSWSHFYHWAIDAAAHDSPYASRHHPDKVDVLHERLHHMTLSQSRASIPSHDDTPLETPLKHDPETLASAHRAFLESLTHSLLLTDGPFTLTLRTLITNIDHLVAHFERLQQIRAEIDQYPFATSDQEGPPPFVIEEETQVELELDRARKRADGDMRSLVSRLRRLDEERAGAGNSATEFGAGPGGMGGFVPLRAGGVDLLLMKLDFGRMSEVETADGLAR